GYQAAMTSLSSFSASDSLSGNAYDNAKAYATGILVPLMQGGILLSQGIAKAAAKLPADYVSEVAPESLDSDVLEEQISLQKTLLASAEAQFKSASKLKDPIAKQETQLRAGQSMARLNAKINELEEKLEKLLAFDGASAKIFSELADLKQAVDQGLAMVMSDFKGASSIPTIKGRSLPWVKTINASVAKFSDDGEEAAKLLDNQILKEEMKKYEKEVSVAYRSLQEKIANGGKFTHNDIDTVLQYAEKHPEVALSPELLNGINGFLSETQKRYDKNSTEFDLIATAIEQLGIGIQRLGGLITVIEGIKGPATTAADGTSTAFVMLDDVANGAGQALVSHGSNITSVGKGVGGVLTGLGFGLGMYNDIVNNDKTVGQALVHNGLSTGLSWGTASLVGLAFTNPVGWVAVGAGALSLAAGWTVSRLFDLAYDNNFLGLQDGLDTAGELLDEAGKSVGQALSKGIEDTKNWASDMSDSIGNAFSDGWSTINPFD
ncbi:hypothetical protein HO422_11515, partial [Streptococcus suis]|nr:hypothetical protein [Streptococcus suis]